MRYITLCVWRISSVRLQSYVQPPCQMTNWLWYSIHFFNCKLVSVCHHHHVGYTGSLPSLYIMSSDPSVKYFVVMGWIPRSFQSVTGQRPLCSIAFHLLYHQICGSVCNAYIYQCYFGFHLWNVKIFAIGGDGVKTFLLNHLLCH